MVYNILNEYFNIGDEVDFYLEEGIGIRGILNSVSEEEVVLLNYGKDDVVQYYIPLHLILFVGKVTPLKKLKVKDDKNSNSKENKS